jgi:hypothetical protein
VLNIHHQAVNKLEMLDILLGQKTVMESEPDTVGILSQKKQVRFRKFLKRGNFKHAKNPDSPLPRLTVLAS